MVVVFLCFIVVNSTSYVKFPFFFLRDSFFFLVSISTVEFIYYVVIVILLNLRKREAIRG